MSTAVIEVRAETASAERRVVWAYAATVFLSAFLLFQVELMLGEYVLPWFGGSAAVWTTTMLVFQTLLFAGYGYAHGIAGRPAGVQKKVHLGLLLASVVGMAITAARWPAPILPGVGWKPADVNHPITTLVAILTISVGLPFFLLSTTGSLMQSWYHRTTERMPYVLYALSNVGSLLGLITYPLVFQPALKLRMRGWIWAALYLVFVGAVALCARSLASGTAATRTAGAPPTQTRVVDRFLWTALAACGSILLLGGTAVISLYLVSVPLIWVVPLVLYLLSFIICFGIPRWYVRGVFHALLAITSMGLMLAIAATLVWVQLGASLALIFVACMVCHGELVRLRPEPQHVTTYYFCISGGGALGGIFVGIVAPVLFARMWEFQFAVISSAVLALALAWRERDSWVHRSRIGLPLIAVLTVFALPWLSARISPPVAAALAEMQYFRYAFLGCLLVAPFLVAFLVKRDIGTTALRSATVAAVILVLAWGFYGVPWGRNGTTLLRVRNFYGVLEVQQSPEERVLMHGKTVHGSQWRAPARRSLPTTYYGEGSGLGQLLAYHPKRRQSLPMRVGVVGMGAGTLAAYGRPGDTIRFYELNPAVTEMVRGPQAYFTFLPMSSAQVAVVPGDGRLSLERELDQHGSQNFDVLVLDAFNGDAIPVHLLTTEAVDLYLQHLAPSGVLAIHTSSTTLDLSPVLFGVMEHFRLHGTVTSMGDRENKVSSTWVLLSRDPEQLRTPGLRRYGQPLDTGKTPVLWTDDHTNIIRLLFW